MRKEIGVILTFLQSIIYGVISGFSEFTPISSAAHQDLLLYFWGIETRSSLIDLFVHLGMLAAIFVSCRRLLSRIRRDRMLSTRITRKRRQALAGVYDVKIAQTAAIPMMAGIVLGYFMDKPDTNLTSISLFFVLNGIFLILTQFVHQGNKDGKSFMILDSIGMGVFGGLSAFTGISRVGASVSYAIYRGAEKPSSYQWALLTSIPVTILLIGLDIFGLFTNPGLSVPFVCCITGMISSYLGTYAAVSFMRYLMVNIGISGFAYYSWGAALFSFIIYLLT